MNQETQERDILIRVFQEKTEEVKAEVRKFLHALNPQSSRSHSPSRELYFQIRSHFPATNPLGFIDFLFENLGKLKEKLISQDNFLPFAKDQIVTLHKELLSIRPHLKNIQDMQSESVELKDLWMQITNAAYQTEQVIDSCQISDFPIWYKLLCLSDVIEEIKFIKMKVKNIMNNQIYINGLSNAKVNSGNIHLGQSSRLDEIVVGFEDEAETIINRLTTGSIELEIVPIVGMPGRGKTTLAKKVYNSPSVRCTFHTYAWCSVTQVYAGKRLLLDILRDIIKGEVYNMSQEDLTKKLSECHEMSEEDLAEKLYQCLKRQRYLIVMDDIWNLTAWNAIKKSFPDDKNGSRILFTSRNTFVYNCHVLRPLNDTEGEELLKKKILTKDETFDMVDEVGVRFPSTLWKMKALRNVNVRGGAAIFLYDYDNNEANVSPQLENLDSFSSLYIWNFEHAEKVLKGFPRIRELKLEFSKLWDCRGNCDQFQVLQTLTKLESLYLKYSRRHAAAAAAAAHTCTLQYPRGLKKLTLSEFRRPWSEISSAIGNLPNLEVLKLLDSAIVGKIWDVEDEVFLKLKYLKLSRLQISEWRASSSSFPCLERLKFCKNNLYYKVVIYIFFFYMKLS
ncbi:hypothetical protein M9H77_24518 [Catharanthus roseus]|uniref:Uncharacterized protein n=1 Tax=Catharanthus roseus TaxID=4058 RepID=A0ACC0AY25_CATRO|nr:hypothetical protein M9H77_24518 [Catharanthus roseus]